MGMPALDSYGEHNRIIDSSKSIWIERSTVFGQWVKVPLVASAAEVTYTKMTQYDRLATKSYRYVGMTKDAALICRRDMIDLYTRSTKYSAWNGTEGEFELIDGGDVLMADIRCVCNNGMWDVIINVNEHDTRLVRTTSPDFLAENQRDYDED